jgi:pilus assembly protein CpaB
MALLGSSANLKRIAPLVIAVGMGFMAMVMMGRYLAEEKMKIEKERQRVAADYRNPIEVVVAGKDLPEGAAIEPSVLKVLKVPEQFAQPYAVRPPAREVLGMVTKVPVAAGEQILTNKVRRPEEAPTAATLSALTPKGKRALTIGMDALSGVGGFVRPGDVVDVLWTVPMPPEQGGPATYSLFQGVTVLAVGAQMMGKPSSEVEGNPNYTVTLALTPEEASLLLVARQQGVVQLSLRSRQDKDAQVAAAPPVNAVALMQAIMGPQAAPAEPEEPPKPPRTVEVYKGLERSVVSLSD